MVLGLNAKSRRGPTVRVDYVIHIQEIKPWPPSQSLRSLRSVLIQWENGERNSGSTKTTSPTIGSIVGEGKIEFNESFKLSVNLVSDMSVKGRDADVFHKNLLEFNLYEPRREKIQLLATGIADLAEYGIIKETVDITVPINSKRSYSSNTAQPILFIKIDRISKGQNISSSRGGLPKELPRDRKRSESVSSLRDEEYAEEAEVASFTDDDVSSHSSLTVSSLTLESNNGSVPVIDDKEVKGENMLASKSNKERTSVANLSSTDLSSDFESSIDAHASRFNSYGSSSPAWAGMRNHGCKDLSQNVCEMVADKGTTFRSDQSKEDASSGYKASAAADAYDCSLEGNSGYGWQENIHEGQYLEENEQLNIQLEENCLRQGNLGTNDGKRDRLMNVKSVQASSDLARSNGLLSNNQNGELMEVGVAADGHHGPGSFRSKLNNERKVSKVYPKDTKSVVLDNKVQQLENRIKMLEGELREAAAIEAALYSVIAEHGSSISKVHAPARRLSRLYLHACKEGSQLRRASAARSAVSGLALVVKACGNDVPRLTFWLSNCVVLRAIISENIGELKLPLSAGPMERNGGRGKKLASSPLKWKESSPGRKENKTSSDWDTPLVFISALERVETWIFSRIIESVWWQTLTPHMQSVARKEIDKGMGSGSSKSYGRIHSSSNQDRGNFSLGHWKKAFKDACERLCPVRAAGHGCGCLCLLSKLIMEQCVARLDVAMFNAILRDSADEIPTDPVSDPISDPLVLPISAGKTSFGAGAQLKNAIGNWSRWLTDLFGIDDDDWVGDSNDEDDSDERQTTSLKSFHLLNALSDLMMLPKDMLLSKPIREEVCPTFAATLIKRVLDFFVPDEFCPDPVPVHVLEALEAENPLEAREGSIMNFPCVASPPVYSLPSATSVASIIGEVGSKSHLRRTGSTVLRKSYTSDDELDELNSPLTSIFNESQSKPNGISKGIGYQSAIRYKLLREVWINSE